MDKHAGRRSGTSLALHVETRSSGKQSRAHPRRQQGQALLELAFLLPMLLLLAMGIVVFGSALNTYLSMTNATAISTQLLSISRGQTTDPCNTTAQAFYSAAPNLAAGSLTFTIVLDGNSVGGKTCSSSSTTTGAAADLVQGTTAQVTVTYPCKLMVMGRNFAPGCVLTAQTAEAIQ
jgi:Flp pilus assembly protein TadG